MNLVDNHHPVTDNMALNMQTISNALTNIDRRVTYYAENIKRQKQLTALQNLTNGQTSNDFLKVSKEKIFSTG